MKKLIVIRMLTVLLLLVGAASASAQDPRLADTQGSELCGTWIGVYRVFLDGDNTTKKLLIKIKSYGDKYVVQVKEVYTYDDQSSKTYYWHECTDVSVNNNTIRWKSFSHQIDDNEDGQQKYNGTVIDRTEYYYLCAASLENGILHFSQAVVGYYYGRNGNKIGEYHQRAYPTKDLYKEDDNW